jgi:hypothetical protein
LSLTTIARLCQRERDHLPDQPADVRARLFRVVWRLITLYEDHLVPAVCDLLKLVTQNALKP